MISLSFRGSSFVCGARQFSISTMQTSPKRLARHSQPSPASAIVCMRPLIWRNLKTTSQSTRSLLGASCRGTVWSGALIHMMRINPSNQPYVMLARAYLWILLMVIVTRRGHALLPYLSKNWSADGLNQKWRLIWTHMTGRVRET